MLLLLSRRRRLLLLRRLSFLTNRQTQRLFHVSFNLEQRLWIILHGLLRILTALAQSFAFIREPRTTLFNHTVIGSKIEQVAFLRNALAVHDVEFNLTEGRRDFVLRDFDFGAIADDAITV